MALPFLFGIPAVQHNGQDQEGQTHNDGIQREAARIGIIVTSVKSINEVNIQGQPDHSLAEESKIDRKCRQATLDPPVVEMLKQDIDQQRAKRDKGGIVEQAGDRQQ